MYDWEVETHRWLPPRWNTWRTDPPCHHTQKIFLQTKWWKDYVLLSGPGDQDNLSWCSICLNWTWQSARWAGPLSILESALPTCRHTSWLLDCWNTGSCEDYVTAHHGYCVTHQIYLNGIRNQKNHSHLQDVNEWNGLILGLCNSRYSCRWASHSNLDMFVNSKRDRGGNASETLTEWLPLADPPKEVVSALLKRKELECQDFLLWWTAQPSCYWSGHSWLSVRNKHLHWCHVAENLMPKMRKKVYQRQVLNWELSEFTDVRIFHCADLHIEALPFSASVWDSTSPSWLQSQN